MAKFSVFAIRSRYTCKFIIFGVIFMCLMLEFMTYWILPLTWIEQPNCQDSHCKKLLLVSDPQIVGQEWKMFFMDFLAQWDCDRFIRRTFIKAVNYLQPDIIIFLGDLMDQGYIASKPDFELYMERLNRIFKLPESLKETTIIFLPGDNDIGGIEEILYPGNVDRFEKAFNQTEESILCDLLEFCKVNVMTSKIQKSKFVNAETIRIALSHAPLLPRQTTLLQEVIKQIRPHLILSGHVHTSAHFTTYENDIWVNKKSSILPSETKPKTYKFHEGLIHELIVPTCSYRMGVYNAGFGSAIIDAKKKVVYFSVLWLPHRLLQLIIYSIILASLIFIYLQRFLKNIWRNRHRNYSVLTSHMP